MELRDAQNHRLTLPFARAPNAHQFHGILAELGELPTHGAVQEHSHQVVKMPLRSRSQVKPLQPLFHGKGFYFGDRITPPPRPDLVREV